MNWTQLKRKSKQAEVSRPVTMGLLFLVCLVIASAILIPTVTRTINDEETLRNDMAENFDGIQGSLDTVETN